MPLPTLTLANASSPTEVWDMFWEAAAYFNEGIPTSDMNIGTVSDLTSSSKNIKPYKVRFGLFGHNHLFNPNWISPRGLKKRHFDLNSCDVLWSSIWDQDRRSNDVEHLVCVAGRVTITITSFVGTAALTKFPGDASSTLDIDTAGMGWKDDSADHWDGWSKKWLGVIVAMDNVLSASAKRTAYVYDDGSGNKVVKVLAGLADATQININYMMFIRYVGSV